MNSMKILLFLSLTTVWVSVFIKYQSQVECFLGHRSSSRSSSGGSSHRISSIFRGGSSSSSSGGSSSGGGIRSSISSAYHKVADKIHHPKPFAPNLAPPTPKSNGSLFGKGKSSQQQPPVQYPNVGPGFIGGSSGGSVGGGFYNPQQSTQSKSKFAILGSLAKKIYDSKKQHSRPKTYPTYMAAGGAGAAMGAGGMYYYNNNQRQPQPPHMGYYNNNGYDYNYRPNTYGSIMGQTCTNNANFEGGIVLGSFMCPVEGFDMRATMCCGLPNEEYCCTPEEAASSLAALEPSANQFGQESALSTCANYLEYNGVVYGVFNCPVAGYDLEAFMCCGQVNQQYCCNQDEYLATNQNSINNTSTEILSTTKTAIQAAEVVSDPYLASTQLDNQNKKLNLNDVSNLYKTFKNSSIMSNEKDGGGGGGGGSILDKAKDLYNMYQTFKNMTKS